MREVTRLGYLRISAVSLYRKILLASCLVLAAPMVRAENFSMSRLETPDLQLLYFDPTETYLTPHVARSFENSMKFQTSTFHWTPWEPPTILLKDFADYGNAAARSSPNNAVMVDIAPLSRTFETFTASERMFALMNHELVHVATMDVWNKRDARWRKFFCGKPMAVANHPESIAYNYLATPRVAVPRWYLEGSAVFMETWMSGGLGRAQGAYDEMVFRAMVRDDAHFFSPLGLVSKGVSNDFQVGVNAYLYGTRFMSYLALTRGPEKLLQWLRRDEGSKAYYADQFAKVYGETIDDVWQQWIEFEHKFQQANLAAVREYPITPVRPVVSRGLGSLSRAFVSRDGEHLVAGIRYPGVLAHIGEISLENGSIKHLVDIKGPMLYRVTSLAYDRAKAKVFYSADNYAMRDLMELDESTGKTKLLIRDGRIGELVFNPADASLWGIRVANGLETLVRIPPPYTRWNQVHTFAYGRILYDMDISPDGKTLSTSMGEINGNQYLRTFDLSELQAGTVKPLQQFEFGNAVPEGFVFSPDGKFLYGSSYYTGVSNIFRFNVSNGDMDAVTNAETGFFRPIPRRDGSLVVFEYAGDGFKPVVVDHPVPLDDLGAIKFLGNEVIEEHPELKSWQVGSPGDIPLEKMVTKRDKYVPIRELGLESAYPVLQGYKKQVSIGWAFNFADSMQFNKLGITVDYSPAMSLPASERKHISIDLERLNWDFHIKHNGSDFYDLFGPIEKSRKGNGFIVNYHRYLVYDKPRQLELKLGLGHYRGLDTLPAAQNVSTPFERLTSASAALEFTNTHKSLNATEHERGYEWSLATSADNAAGETFRAARAGLNFGFPVGLPHSSLWFYNALGRSWGTKGNPLSSFYFGAFQNNYVDRNDVKRYRDFQTFPGFDIDALSGRRFERSLLEWNLPPYRFEEAGSPGAYLTSMSPAIFAGILRVGPDTDGQWQRFSDLGFQVDLDFTVVHRLPMTLSVGYAIGLQDGRKVNDEWMVSLKVM